MLVIRHLLLSHRWNDLLRSVHTVSSIYLRVLCLMSTTEHSATRNTYILEEFSQLFSHWTRTDLAHMNLMIYHYDLAFSGSQQH